MAKQKSFLRKVLTVLVIITIASATAMLFTVYKIVYKGNIDTHGKNSVYIYIKSTDSFEDVMNELATKNILINLNTFKQLAQYKGYHKTIKPGKYLLKAGMNNNQVVNILKAGLEEKIKFNLNNIRTIEQLGARLENNTEIDSATFVEYIYSEVFLSEAGLSKANAITYFVPGEFEFKSWATGIKDVIKKAEEISRAFWSSKSELLNKLNLSQQEIYTLASIVQLEQTQHVEERPTIAGVYLNRLKKGMKLQADPTVIFAVGDFTINRVLNKHLEIDSPFNTYKFEGLPPGPICIPTLHALNAVLNYKKHDYIFFCAKEDLSGKHYFTSSYNDHVKCANKYRAVLDKKGILN